MATSGVWQVHFQLYLMQMELCMYNTLGSCLYTKSSLFLMFSYSVHWKQQYCTCTKCITQELTESFASTVLTFFFIFPIFIKMLKNWYLTVTRKHYDPFVHAWTWCKLHSVLLMASNVFLLWYHSGGSFQMYAFQLIKNDSSAVLDILYGL